MGTKTLLTFEEFERLPDRPGKRELLKGELIELPPPEINHDRIARRVYKSLDAALDTAHEHGEAMQLSEVCISSGYRLSDGWVVPDVSVAHAGQPETKYLEGAPAIAIEVVSPGKSAENLDTKTSLHFEFGAIEVWRIYPKTRHIDVHVPGAVRVFGIHDAVTTPLLPGFAMPVKEILVE